MTTTPQPLRSITPPRQARSEDSLRRLLDAAVAVIEEHGHQNLSIAEVARRAGSSVGGFYARFRSKDELVRAVEEDFFQRLNRMLDDLSTPERWAGTPAPEIIRAMLAVLIDTHRRHRQLILAFVARAVRDPSHHPVVLEFRRRVGERLGAFATARQDLIAHPDPPLAAEFAVQAVFGILQARVVSSALGAPQAALADDVLAAELERLVLGYLGLSPNVPPEDRSTR